MSEQFSLFDELDQESKQAEALSVAKARDFQQQLTKCHFCGEVMTRGVMANNHGIVFNGWCIKALMYHTRTFGRIHTEEARWLESKGVDPMRDRFDETHWNRQNVAQHFAGHYGRCYEGDCK